MTKSSNTKSTMTMIPQLNLTQSSLGLAHTSGDSEKGDGGSVRHDDYATSKDEKKSHPLQTVKSANSFTISPEMFEKMYLSPENQVKGDLRKTFGNPTPLFVPPDHHNRIAP